MVTTAGFRIQVRFQDSDGVHRTPAIGDSGFRRLLWNLIPALPLCCLLVAGIIKAQMPANTPIFSVNAKWVTDHGSQLYNVKGYGANCTASDNSSAFAAALAAIPAGGGTLFLPPCATPYVLSSARLAITTSNVKVSGYGASLLCTVSDDCVTLGNLANNTLTSGITIEGLTIWPGAGSAGHAAIRDNAFGSHLVNLNEPNYSTSYYFKNFIEVDGDFTLQITGLNYNTGILECDAGFCGNIVYATATPPMNSGIAYISDSMLDPECHGNGIEYDSGNDLKVSGVVIQAYNQYGIRAYGGITNHISLQQIHSEPGGCTNPIGNVGAAGIASMGMTVSNFGGQTGGKMPVFPQAGTTGSINYSYYIVAHSSTYGPSGPLAAGYLTNGNATVNSTNKITATWNDFSANAGTVTYDVLRYPATYNPRTAPYGTGNWAVATGLTPASTCSAGLCTFVDTVTSPSSYSVPWGNYVPSLPLWPGSVVLSLGTSGNNCNYSGVYYGDAFSQGSTIVAPCAQFPGYVTVFGLANDYSGDPLPFGPHVVTALNVGNVYPPSSALLLANNYNSSKGMINFGTSSGSTDKITLNDCNPYKAISTVGADPSWDACDTAIGFDGTNNALSTRAATTISQYINHLPDGTSWLEQLASGLKVFKVPLGSFTVAQVSPPGGLAGWDNGTGGTLSPNTQYCYGITAVDALGESAPDYAGNYNCYTTANDGNSTHSITVRWWTVAGATQGYNIYGRSSSSYGLITSTPVLVAGVGTVGTWNDTGSVTPGRAMSLGNTTGQVKPALYSTATNCSSSASPAICGSAAAGSFVIAAGTTSVVVDTTAVTANSQILLTEDSSLGTGLGVTCNTQSLLTLGVPKVTARTGGTSFTASVEVGPTTNPLCISYAIFN